MVNFENIFDDMEDSSCNIGTGSRTRAEYGDPGIKAYRGNPFIEALPPVLTGKEALAALTHKPEYDEAEKGLPDHLRVHAIMNALEFFTPLDIHLELEDKFSRLIRRGYRVRNPFLRNSLKDIEARLVKLASSRALPSQRVQNSPLGFSIIGFPGVGKTSSANAILSLYPQVIYHREYQGAPFTRTQITWLKLECPHDGSARALCLGFFQTLDDLLGTNLFKKFAAKLYTTDVLLIMMARFAALVGLGVLVIDEIQHLRASSTGGDDKFLNFFVQLSNVIGIPVVFIGTFKAMKALAKEFRQIRRGCGFGDKVWEPMKEGEWVEVPEKDRAREKTKKTKQAGEKGDWQQFLESLWRYVYVRKGSPLTRELSRVLYEETQGIADFAVKIFMLAQVRAIVNGDEQITRDNIFSVARDSLQMAQPVLEAMRTGDSTTLARYEDVQMPDIDEMINEELKGRKAQSLNAKSLKANSPETKTTAPAKPRGRGGRAGKKGATEIYAEGDLRGIAAGGAADGLTAYESMTRAGVTDSGQKGIAG